MRSFSTLTSSTLSVWKKKTKLITECFIVLHLGQDIQKATQEIKQKCKLMHKSVRKSAKAMVTKLAPGAFSQKPASPATAPSLPAITSSSSWKFWPSQWMGPMQCQIWNQHCLIQTLWSQPNYNFCSGLPENMRHPLISFTSTYPSTFLNFWQCPTKFSTNTTITSNYGLNHSEHRPNKWLRSANPELLTKLMISPTSWMLYLTIR